MGKKLYRQIEVERLVAEAEEEGLAESGWLATMADMMTLLLTFFVMLLALAAPESQKYIEALSEVGSAFGGKSLVETKAEEKKIKKKDIKEELKKVIEDNNLSKDVIVTEDSRGLVIYSRGDFFFKPGTSELIPETQFFLKRITKILKDTKGDIMIEGHTDDLPLKPGGRYPTNWELSSARASSVARYFIEDMKLHPGRFIVAGYAEFKPRYAVIPANRGKNRRVEIILMKK
ncbi:MAG: OmpA family protein [Nitrospinota bacterium]|nr:OmpA family protein [Nitrospinota bacterium]